MRGTQGEQQQGGAGGHDDLLRSGLTAVPEEEGQ
jgi:hypothetical protein